MKEVKLKRVAGPYDKIPFDNYIQSPIGLVPKAGTGDKTRLIFHLSYDFGDQEKSVNAYTPKDLFSVHYCDLDHTVNNMLKIRDEEIRRWNQCHEDHPFPEQSEPEQPIIMYTGKSDAQSAFHILPLKKSCYQ